ncbi:MAG: glutamate racemase [Peptococcaceae bacterium]|nr:glutamate racemase [Peptococcaceae bacterium]
MASPHLIGVFDSGVGGLSVVREILRQLPQEQVIYFGDTEHVPYGCRSVIELISFADAIADYLLMQGAEIIVVACNTSASVSLQYLRAKLAVPVVGVVEPGAFGAAAATRNRRVGLIATEATVKSGSYARSLTELDPGVKLFAKACPLFVPLVEAGLAATKQAKAIARTYLKSLQAEEIDTLILGCTHYPFLAPVLQEILGPGVQLVDPAQATVAQTAAILAGLPRSEETVPAFGGGQNVVEHSYFVSGDPELFHKVGSAFLANQLPKPRQVILSTSGKEDI